MRILPPYSTLPLCRSASPDLGRQHSKTSLVLAPGSREGNPDLKLYLTPRIKHWYSQGTGTLGRNKKGPPARQQATQKGPAMRRPPPDLGTILGSLFLSHKRQFDATAAVLSQMVFNFGLRHMRGQEVYWAAGRGDYAQATGYCIKTISREYKTLEALGYIEVEHRPPDGAGKWQTNLIRPGKRLWGAVRAKARELWRRGFHRGTQMSHKPQPTVDIELNKEKKPLREDSLPLSKSGQTVHDRVLRITNRAPPR